MEVTIYIGDICVSAAADDPYTPDIADDLTRRAVQAAIHLQRELLAEHAAAAAARKGHTHA